MWYLLYIKYILKSFFQFYLHKDYYLLVNQNLKHGIIFGLISAFFFAIMSIFVKILGPNLPVSMLIFFRFSLSLLFLIPFLLRDPEFEFKLIPSHPKMYFMRIFCPMIALAIIFYSIPRFKIVDVLLLQNSAPLFVPLLAWLIAGVSTPKMVKIGIVIGFIGVAITLNPTSNLLDDIYSLIPLAAGLMIAITVVYIRLIGKVNTPKQIFFYYFFFTTLISGIWVIFDWKTPVGTEQWILIIGISLSGLIYQVFSTMSYLKAPVRIMSPLVFMQTVFGGILDWFILDNIPGISTLIGAILVITGGVITVYFGLHLVKQN